MPDRGEWLILDQHARDSGAVIEVNDHEYGLTPTAGHPIRMSATPPAVQFPRRPLDADRAAILAELENLPAPAQAPAPDAAGVARPPLAGIRVIDVSQVLAGPTVSRVLAEYGAEVVKIHSFTDRQLGMHLYTNSGKCSIMLDLKTAEGMAVFERLADGVNVFVQNFTRGVADRLGVGEASVPGTPRTLSTPRSAPSATRATAAGGAAVSSSARARPGCRPVSAATVSR